MNLSTGSATDKSSQIHIPSFSRGIPLQEEITYKLWVTKGTRYKAARRLEHRAQLSNTTVAVFTFYLIVIAFLPLFFTNLSDYAKSFCSFLSTSGSIGILVFSLIESGRDYKTRAYKYHECARKINQIYEKIRVSAPDNDSLKAYSDQYQDTLNSYENHEDIDYYSFKSENHVHFKLNSCGVALMSLKYHISQSLVYYIFISLPFLILITVYVFQIKL